MYKRQAKYVLILGEEEVIKGIGILKDMETGEQKNLYISTIEETMVDIFKEGELENV